MSTFTPSQKWEKRFGDAFCAVIIKDIRMIVIEYCRSTLCDVLEEPMGVGESGVCTVKLGDYLPGVMVDVLAGERGKGFADGPAKSAQFTYPADCVLLGWRLLITDCLGKRIRSFDLTTSTVSTLVGKGYDSQQKDGTFETAGFNTPYGIVLDKSDGCVIITDESGDSVRAINLKSETVDTIVAGNGRGSSDGIGSGAQLCSPNGLAADGRGNLWVADRGNNCIRSIDRKTRMVTTLAGNPSTDTNIDGIGTAAGLAFPKSVAYSEYENALYIGCSGAIRRLNLHTKEVTTIHMTVDSYAWGIAALSNGMLIFSCSHNHSIYVLHPDSGHIIRLAGTGDRGKVSGEGSKSQFNFPAGFAVDEVNCRIFVCEDGHRVCCITIPK